MTDVTPDLDVLNEHGPNVRQVRAWMQDWLADPEDNWGDKIAWETALEIAKRLDALARRAVPGGGWHTMDSAPRDGTHFLAVDEAGDASRCAYHRDGYIVSFCGQPVVQPFEPTLWMSWPSTELAAIRSPE